MTDEAEVVVYWRRGCPYCSSLFRELKRSGVRHRRVDIWSDPGAAAVVRSLANGNETVPTVLIGGEAFVNPPGRHLVELVRERVPGAVVGPDDVPRRGWFGRRRS